MLGPHTRRLATAASSAHWLWSFQTPVAACEFATCGFANVPTMLAVCGPLMHCQAKHMASTPTYLHALHRASACTFTGTLLSAMMYAELVCFGLRWHAKHNILVRSNNWPVAAQSIQNLNSLSMTHCQLQTGEGSERPRGPQRYNIIITCHTQLQVPQT